MMTYYTITLYTGETLVFVSLHFTNNEIWYECMEPNNPYPRFIKRDEFNLLSIKKGC